MLQHATTMSQIARLVDQRPFRDSSTAQLLRFDYFCQDGALEDHIEFCHNGAWVRVAQPSVTGSRVVLHLVLPDLLAPVVVEGTVAGHRHRAPSGALWSLIWFDADPGEDSQLLRRYLSQLDS